MLWELSVTEQRYRAALEVRAGVPVVEVADRYGVIRQSVHAHVGSSPPGLLDQGSMSGAASP
jgi:hypothetical protein